MNSLDEKICEQLSALMDGELPADEARFLERRLANEPALRERWERMQLASACMKGQPLRLMRASLAENVAKDLAIEPTAKKSRRPLLGWAIAASVALLAVAFGPRWGSHETSSTAPVLADTPVIQFAPFVATPSSADLVAEASATAAPMESLIKPAPRSVPAKNPDIGKPTIAAVAGTQSPSDFPLVEGNGTKAWPRSTLPSNTNDPALEAYLVRHNQMMSDDGLSGFVPYVDVVSNDPGNAAGENQSGGTDK
ncbi:MAG TPA: RseA family anti-sigma factor [Arenimonas sp.]|uniref:sigma-E factor negative regulatory protein n=1 Tax=Arenimonas sp. TaxID=1872635 RepID=UPI002BEC350E|nr:RseA family anti-sigma factor [Arenimonas sp.]HMB56837.1 RseA family anti-sigma factor [Arenimonas sp.]